MTRKTTRGGHPAPCTCDEVCRPANAAYEKNRYRKIGYGQWNPWMPAGPVREHVTALMGAGVGLYRIADLAGVSPGALRRLLYGAPCEGKPPSAGIRWESGEAILAVTAMEPNLSGNTPVDSTGTRRRLQGLVALGWPATALGPLVGLYPEHVRRITRGYPQVTAATARNVRDAYTRLSHKCPPETTRQERATAARSRGLAAKAGWVIPGRWDDDLIDDPAAQPSPEYAGHSRTWLLEDDGDVDEIAVKLAATGERDVPLSWPEREAAARLIVARGGGAELIKQRLHVNGQTASELAAQAASHLAAQAEEMTRQEATAA